jgi:hypothetical protein
METEPTEHQEPKLPLESYTIPQETLVSIYIIDEPTKSVLLFNNPDSGLTGYVYKDPTGSLTIKSQAVEHLFKATGILAEENGIYCPDVLEEITINNGERKSSWTFVVIIKKFSICGDIPENSKWYNFNGLPLGKIRSKKERVFLQDAIRTR